MKEFWSVFKHMKLFIAVIFFVTFIKFLFYQTYVSTDFEVHRNWLAIANSLPISKWYFDNTSKWTLDYPPFFAWFEYSMSILANKFDKNMTQLENLDYMSPETRFFQKFTVILSDFLYIYAIFKIICCKPISKRLNESLFVVLLSLRVLAPFGLLLIDHIHFQYNGVLFGILLLSIYNIMNGRYYWSSFWFTILLNCKHIFIYYAPAYVVFLLFHYCISKDKDSECKSSFFNYRRFLTLGCIVISVFIVSFGPFIVMNQLGQVLGRLFPFNERGLTHAYWAPNLWAIYNFCDLIGNRLFVRSTVAVEMTRGLVERYMHVFLPNISPLSTVMITAISIVPSMLKCRTSKSPCDFLKLLTISGWSAFMFGWHVHEKAVLMITIPLMIVEILDGKTLGFSFYVTTIGHFSLLPLVPTIPEYTLKTVLFLACTCTHYVHVNYLHENVWQTIHPWFRFHLVALIPLSLLTDFVLPIVLPRFEFLPLLLISVASAIGLSVAYVQFYLYYVTGSDKWCCHVSAIHVTTEHKNK